MSLLNCQSLFCSLAYYVINHHLNPVQVCTSLRHTHRKNTHINIMKHEVVLSHKQCLVHLSHFFLGMVWLGGKGYSCEPE